MLIYSARRWKDNIASEDMKPCVESFKVFSGAVKLSAKSNTSFDQKMSNLCCKPVSQKMK